MNGQSVIDRTLAAFPARRNSLNVVRLVLAALVIVSHAWPLGGFGEDPQLGGVTLGTMAVAGFFAVSGWLITNSRMGGTLRSFAWRRLVRIYPGYVAALVVVAFGFAPVGAWVSTGTYSVTAAVDYVTRNLGMLQLQWTVGASLPAERWPAWNGSLWTLFSEVLCYVAVGLIVTLAGRRGTPIVVVAAWVGLTALQLRPDLVDQYVPWFLRDFVGLAPFFFAGAVLFVARRHIRLGGWLAVVAASLISWVFLLSAPFTLASIPVAYLMMWLGARLPLQQVGRRHDLSYGLYIYAFPVQQLLAMVGVNAAGPGWFAAACVAATVPVAAASWFLVERPAQRARGLFDSPRSQRPPIHPWRVGAHRSGAPVIALGPAA